MKKNKKIYEEARMDILAERGADQVVDEETIKLIEERYNFLLKNRSLKEKISDLMHSRTAKILGLLGISLVSAGGGAYVGYKYSEKKNEKKLLMLDVNDDVNDYEPDHDEVTYETIIDDLKKDSNITVEEF